MAILNRIQSGQAQVDTFDEVTLDPVWIVTPNDPLRYSVTDRPGFLRLMHGSPNLYLLRDEPGSKYLMDLKLDYTPDSETDQGGLVAYRSNEQMIELVSYYDAGQLGPWVGMRLYRNGTTYQAYASADGDTWIYIGSQQISLTDRIGLTLHSAVDTTLMDVDTWQVASDRYVHVGNLLDGMYVELADSLGDVVVTATCTTPADRIVIDMIERPIPFEGTLRLYGASSLLLHETELGDIWPGDIFWYDVNMQLWMNGELVSPDSTTYLGTMQDGYIEVPLMLVNVDPDTVINVLVAMQQFQTYRGWDWVQVAPDILGVPGDYVDNVPITSLVSGGTFPFWMRVETPDEATAFDAFEDWKFQLVIRN
jgi:hypothetical protein